MNELVAFTLGLAFKSLLTVTVGSLFTKLTNVAIEDIREWPMVRHYLHQHPKRSYNCDSCRLNEINQVDAVTSV